MGGLQLLFFFIKSQTACLFILLFSHTDKPSSLASIIYAVLRCKALCIYMVSLYVGAVLTTHLSSLNSKWIANSSLISSSISTPFHTHVRFIDSLYYLVYLWCSQQRKAVD